MIDKQKFYSMMRKKGNSDYEIYLRTNEILNCQKDFDELCNADELQFQIVHQIIEMLLKLMAYTLIDIMEYMKENKTFRVLTYFHRVHIIQQQLINMIDLLETMSPSDYQEIRLHLGSGSGMTSPGFRVLRGIFPEILKSFQTSYLDRQHLTIKQLYHENYTHNDAYVIAEAMVEMDERYQRFFKRHFELVSRTIGENSKSLRGHSAQDLKSHLESHLFPTLWEVRSQMTDAWGQEYGAVRESISDKKTIADK